MKITKMKYILYFILCFFSLDFCIGYFFDNMLKKMPQDGEKFAKSYFSFNKVKTDILIIGSSRAENGYIPQIIIDSIPQISIYNCGADGENFYYCNTLINCILDRYHPKCIIWDFKEKELGGTTNEDLSLLYPYFWKNDRIKKILTDKEDSYFKIKIFLNSFRYSATAGRILKSIYLPNKNFQNTYGFSQREITQSRIIYPEDFYIEDTCTINKDKISAFIRTLKRAQTYNTKMIIVNSPMYNKYNQNNIFSRTTDSLCTKYEALFIDDSHLNDFIHNNELSSDNYHLNIKGAKLFTKTLVHQIKSFIEENVIKKNGNDTCP